jgi:hypothetical protein
MVVKVHPAPFGPKVIEDEITKNVKRLLNVRKAPDVVTLDAGGGGSSSHSNMASTNRMKGHEGVTSFNALHFCRTHYKASQSCLAWGHSIGGG